MNNTITIGTYRIIVSDFGYVICSKWTDEFGILHTNEQEVEASHERTAAMVQSCSGGDIEIVDNRSVQSWQQE